jgi:hypothetical protein
VNYWLIRLLFRLPFGDFQNVTVYPRALIQSVMLETESSFTNAECLLKTWWRGATFREVEVPFLKRERGRGTGTKPRAIINAIRDILTWWLRWIVWDGVSIASAGASFRLSHRHDRCRPAARIPALARLLRSDASRGRVRLLRRRAVRHARMEKPNRIKTQQGPCG